MTGDNAAVISDDLIIRGITKSVDLDTTFIKEGNYPCGVYHAGFTGTTTIKLGDYGMGAVLSDEEVALTIVAEGIRQ